MPPIPWTRLHGATTHFPIVLSLVAFGCDLFAAWRWEKAEAAGLMHVALAAIVVAAVGSVGAVVAGLFLTHGEMWGTGDLGRHHRFVWPAFVMITGAAAWRLAARRELTRAQLFGYSAAVLACAGLIAASAFNGGELLLSAS